MKSWHLTLPLVVAVASLGIGVAHGQPGEEAAAEAAAGTFFDHLETADLGGVYDQELSDSFHAMMARKTFIDQISVAKIQAGGNHLGRDLVGAHEFDRLPTGQTGEFYYVRFKTRFPNAIVFQDAYLEKVGPAWKITASLSLPAPP